MKDEKTENIENTEQAENTEQTENTENADQTENSENAENKEQSGEKYSFAKFVDDALDITESVIFSIFIVLLTFTYLFRVSDVSGPSMEPTLIKDDRLVISSLFYTPKQNDIIIVDSKNLNKLIVKRVVALEGQSVNIDFESGIVSVDGVPLDEQLYEPDENGIAPVLKADHFVNTLTTLNMGAFDSYPVTVPEGHVFVLGDNRNSSKDSKHIELGFVPEDEIVGKALLRIYPFSRFGTLD